MKHKIAQLIKKWQANSITLIVPLTLLLVLASVAIGLAGLVRQLEPWLMFPLSIAGVGVGWWLARQRVALWWVIPISLVVGVAVVFVRVGRLGESLWAVIIAVANLPRQLWLALRANMPLSGELLEAIQQLGQNSAILFQRLWLWLFGLFNNQPTFDPTAATLLWSLVMWLVAVWAGWVLKRKSKPLLAIFPAGCVLSLSLYFAGGQIGPLLWFLGGLLLLVAFSHYTKNNNTWQETDIKLSKNLQSEFALTSTLMALLLVALAALAPLLTVESAVKLFEQLTADRLPQTRPLVRSLGLNPVGLAEQDSLSAVRRPGMPRSHLIGAGPELAETLIMRVQVSAVADDALTEAEQALAPARYYWRSLSYDFYTGRGWRSGNTETINYAPDTWLKEEADPNLKQIQQTIEVLDEGDGLLYAAGKLLTADTDFGVAWRLKSDGTLVSDAFGATTVAKNYQVLSQIPLVSEADLRAEGTNYPTWIRERYLPLSERVPPHVLALARDLTATAPTPYDRAKAIESYLRTFPYNLDVPAPPPNREIADFFLFDLQQGYCDYYATSMVVLARAAGLPARLAVGFAQGTYDETEDAYIVSALNAHSWVEIYFPSYGWIAFEPTAGLAAIERPVAVERATASDTSEGDIAPSGPAQNGVIWGLALAGVLLLLIIISTGGLIIDTWYLNRLSGEETLGIIYSRFYHQLNGLGLAVPVGDTPYQLAARFKEYASALSAHSDYWQNLFKATDNEMNRLITLFVKAQYSPNKLTKVEQAEAIKQWRKLRWRLWLARLWRR